MAKEKKPNDNHNPFSILKGLSVPGQKEEVEVTVKKPVPIEPQHRDDSDSTDPIDEVDLFEQEMGLLGVQKTIQDAALEKAEPPFSQDPPNTPLNQTRSADVPSADSRRNTRKFAKRVKETEATLDLHGVAAADVVNKVDQFLANASFHGCRAVKIVTGKGVHSTEGPVLRPLVEAYLSGSGRRFVGEWGRAPQHLGGAGVLLILLRK
jgi:DNA-nicking Smr family endonuclease